MQPLPKTSVFVNVTDAGDVVQLPAGGRLVVVRPRNADVFVLFGDAAIVGGDVDTPDTVAAAHDAPVHNGEAVQFPYDGRWAAMALRARTGQTSVVEVEFGNEVTR